MTRSHPSPPTGSAITQQVRPGDRAAVKAQLGRPPRAMTAVAHRCACGLPDVVRTNPRLADGSPFPTLYYLTCPRAAAAVSRLEAGGTMREMSQRLADDEQLRTVYTAAHVAYLKERDSVERLPTRESAGGMPARVKCLHALVAHSLAVGPGVNPLGDETLAAIGPWWNRGPCVASSEPEGDR